MGVDENKALIRRFYEEVWAKGDPDVSDEVFHDEYIRHDLRAGAAEPGPAGQTKIALDFRRGFPDVDWHVDLISGDGDFVVGRWTATGNTHRPVGSLRHRPGGPSRSPASTSFVSRTARSPRSGTIATTSG